MTVSLKPFTDSPTTSLTKKYLAEVATQLLSERDELQRAILRLPKPPDAMGDGPDERVTNALKQIELLGKIISRFRNEFNAACAEMDRLHTFVSEFDVWVNHPR